MICKDPNCKGCIEVAPGVHLHPRKTGKEFADWTKVWEDKAKEKEPPPPKKANKVLVPKHKR